MHETSQQPVYLRGAAGWQSRFRAFLEPRRSRRLPPQFFRYRAAPRRCAPAQPFQRAMGSPANPL